MGDTQAEHGGTGRIGSLDITRGFAVMGILLLNIISFAMPEPAYINPQAWGGTSAADVAAWTLNQLFFEGRMRGLFALLFGAGAMLVLDRAAAAGQSPAAIHLRRMVVLALFGALHLFLLWTGDILLHYAIVGAVLPLVRHLEPRTLVRLAVAALVLQTLWWTSAWAGMMAWRHAAALPDADAATVQAFADAYAALPGPGNADIAQELRIHRGSFGDAVRFRLDGGISAPLELLNTFGGETLGSMLLGAALIKSGFFSGGWSDRALRRLAIVGIATGLPVFALMTWWALATGFDRIVLMGNFVAWVIPFRTVMMLGYAALIVLAARWFAGSALLVRVAAAGRMAFTNYLATSLVMTTIFNGYGLGLYGRVGRAEVYLFVFGMWALMLAWSAPWLARFRYGPLEWVWRSLARWQRQPMRRPGKIGKPEG